METILNESKTRGWDVKPFEACGDTYYLIRPPNSEQEAIYWRMRTPILSSLGETTCVQKRLTYEICEFLGIPYPKTLRLGLEQSDDALSQFLAEHKRVVIKPNCGAHGSGVAVNLTTLEAARNALTQLSDTCTQPLVQAMAKGQDYRIMVVGDRVSAASQRIPAHVIGDGTNTVRQLIHLRNKEPNRGSKHSTSLSLISFRHSREFLGSKEALDRVPQVGETVFLTKLGNLSQGGESRTIPAEEIHPSICKMAVRLAQCLGMGLLAVDIMAPNLTHVGSDRMIYTCSLSFLTPSLGLSVLSVCSFPSFAVVGSS